MREWNVEFVPSVPSVVLCWCLSVLDSEQFG
jgi:hypothetical protein